MTNDQIDAAGQLTQRVTGRTTTKQSFDPNGGVLTALSGSNTSYRPDGLPDSVTKGGTTTTFTYWPDGTRRRATTVDPQAGTTTTGAGVGYYLRDRHTSVTALVDSGGAVTATYAYGDYGAAVGTAPGQTNPFQYNGAALQGLYTDTMTGLIPAQARSYDPLQGRFTTRDSANVHNRYVGFDTNPIMKVDPTGHSALADAIIDALFVLVFAVATVETGGAFLGMFAAAEAGAEAATVTTLATVAEGVATAANLTGLAANGTRLADDVDTQLTGQHFLNDDQRNDLMNVGTVAAGVAGAAGIVAAVASVEVPTAKDV